MGGDDSQKLLPWRGLHSSPGRKPPAQYKTTLAQRQLLTAYVPPLPVGRRPLSSRAVRVQILTGLPCPDLFPVLFELSESSLKTIG
jgi:hypothetical protein